MVEGRPPAWGWYMLIGKEDVLVKIVRYGKKKRHRDKMRKAMQVKYGQPIREELGVMGDMLDEIYEGLKDGNEEQEKEKVPDEGAGRDVGEADS